MIQNLRQVSISNKHIRGSQPFEHKFNSGYIDQCLLIFLFSYLGEFVDLGSSKYRKNADEELLSESLLLCHISDTQAFEDKWFKFLCDKNSQTISTNLPSLS